MHGRREYYRHWLRCYARGLPALAIAALLLATLAAAATGQAGWLVAGLTIALGLVASWRAARVTYELHARVVSESMRVIGAHARRCAQEMEQHRRAMAAETAAMRLDVRVLREQVADLKKAERRAIKLARQRLDAALADCKHVYEDAGLTPNAVVVELNRARQKVKGVLKPERADLFAELTTQYARLLKQDELGAVSEAGLTREQVATIRRASVAPSIEWLRDTIQQLQPDDLDPAFRP